ncbi:hypothetical protein [Marivirga sp.]|uniref:hypothetical protein n=1 Tax=Marivirga sp. TaxID=2018662 RepID=UPI002D80F355|nr:hypothetical protein [Marivirga sp.]HET8859530.1 hypothetical protein [Marivirga sp.]
MNNIFSLYFIFLLLPYAPIDSKEDQQAVLQSVFNIEEFQNYLAYSPRFVSTNSKQEVLMVGFPELESRDMELTVREKSIKIISENVINELELNFFIKIDEFDINRSSAKVLLSYQNARMYFEKEQKILLDAQLEKTSEGEWIVKNYNLYEVSTNTSD